MRSAITRFGETQRGLEVRAKSPKEATAREAAERDQATEEVARLREEAAKLRDDLAWERERSATWLKEKEDNLQREKAELSCVCANLEFSENERHLVANRALNNEERARTAREEARAAGERASATEMKATEAEKRASEAVEIYKNSPLFRVDTVEVCTEVLENYKNSADFRADAAAACVDVYSIGFYDCKRMVENTFPELDLRALVAPGDEEEEEEEGDEVPEVPPVTAASSGEIVPSTADAPSASDLLLATEAPLTSGAPLMAEAPPAPANPDDDDVVEVPGSVAAAGA